MTATEDNFVGGNSYYTYFVEYSCPVKYFLVEEDTACFGAAGFQIKSDVATDTIIQEGGILLEITNGTVLVNLDDNFHVQVVTPGKPCLKDVPVEITFESGQKETLMLEGPDCTKQCPSGAEIGKGIDKF